MSKEERIEKNPEGKRISNKTQLYIDKASERGQIHRDYVAHCLRWSHVTKYAAKLKKPGGINVLDVGCGDFALMRTLYVNKFKPNYYMGIDIRDMSGTEGIVPNFEYEFKKCDFVDGIPSCKYDSWDMITFFEVLEHVPKDAGITILNNIKAVMSPETYFFMSTPCFNGKAAENHVYEWKYQELKEQLESMFTIEQHYGTFASQSEIVPYFSNEDLSIFERLKDYYDSNLLSVMLSPLYPHASRNCIWRLRLKS